MRWKYPFPRRMLYCESCISDAYNAGPGNVNKWLRQNGDPRTGAISWLDWIERIPIFETKNYVARVIENAAVYEALYPDRASLGRPRPVSEFLR